MGPDGYFRFILALIFVIALIGVLAAIARRMGLGFPSHAIKSGSDRRIGIVEVTPLDARRKLILVRRDDTEHLLVVSSTSETVIERNIRPDSDFEDALQIASAQSASDEREKN